MIKNICHEIGESLYKIYRWVRHEGDSTSVTLRDFESALRLKDQELREEKENTEAMATRRSKEIQELRQIIKNLKSVNHQLEEANRISEAHIFSLQSYRPELTTDEARRMYKELVDGVSDWVEDWAEPISEPDFKPIPPWLEAKHRPACLEKFILFINQHRDLKFSIRLPDIDQEVLTATVIRFLYENVFSVAFTGTSGYHYETIMSLAESMIHHMDPKLDLVAVRIWRAQACRSLIAHPDYIVDRQNHVNALSSQLFELLEFLPKKPKDVYRDSIQSMIVEPAVRLQERFLTESNLFHLSFDSRGPEPGSSVRRDLSDAGLASYIYTKELVDIAKSNRKLLLDKLDPPPNTEEVRENLYIMCSMYPALIKRGVGERDDYQEPQVVFKEKILVAWAPPDVKIELNSRMRQGHLYRAISEATSHAR
ncbi:hypothetical protein F4810DRAFT_232726 [Camillea tinctor]|nr:hypothetical protein F4810DRAFT_232726 [Camillea tinctor]